MRAALGSSSTSKIRKITPYPQGLNRTILHLISLKAAIGACARFLREP
jgi:hypothetical protein